MTGQEVIELIGLDRAKSVNFEGEEPLESESFVFDQVREFGVDAVYFNTDESGNSFPAVFLKEVKSFDDKTLQNIADIHKKVWNYKKVLFLYVYSDTEIRIYNCSEKPLIKTKENCNYEKELQNVEIKVYQFSDKEQLEELNNLFSRIAIDSGIVWTLQEAQFIRDKIKLQRRVDKYLVESLVNTANQLEQQGLEIEFIHKIILRSLFLLYLEDRGATDEKLYDQIKKGTKSYFDILNDVEATYKLYKRLEDDFNGNVFTLERNANNTVTEKISADQLQLIKKCFISGNDNTTQTQLFENWRLFDFSIIQIELLSEIYENFLFKTDPELKKKTGTYYTPPALVEFILNEKLPVNKTDKKYNVKILDPSCGSGIFLVQSFKRLVKRYENQHKEKLTDFDKLKKLLTDNIFGIELHAQAIKVAAFSLYLALVDSLDPKTLWQTEKHRLPNLINNPNDKSLKAQGGNLFCRDTIKQNKDIEAIEFDLVVGNPPFGTTDLLESIRNYCDEYGFAKEMVLPFLHKATTFAPNGEIALIFNTKVLTNTGGTYQNFRKWLFNDCYVEKVFNFSILRNAKKNFGGQLFGDATGPISIVFYQKEQPKKINDKIAYYAPKTYIKSNVIEGLCIDFTDLKYLPREECRKPDTKIWKVAMWGGMNDWELIKSLTEEQMDSLLSQKSFVKGLGLQFLDKSTKKPITDNTIPKIYIKPQSIERFSSSSFSELNGGLTEDSKKIYAKYYKTSTGNLPQINVFRRTGTKGAYKAPHILVKEGLANWQICASYLNEDCSFNSKVLGIHHTDTKLLKGITCLLNSKFALYYIFLTSASIGIEREEIKPNELYNLPLFLELDDFYKLSQLYDKHIVDNILIREQNIETLELKIDEYIYRKLSSLKQIESFVVEDFVSYTLPLLKKNVEEINLPPNIKNISEYAKFISEEMNDFLDGQDLFVNATIYNVNRFTPLMMIKLSHEKVKKDVSTSNEHIDKELKKIDQHLWEEKSSSIYFRKKLNYKTGDDIYIIRPNQRRFWSKSMAVEDAQELILEILNED
ncbi:MAG: SAM-dependent methyltransferase [Lentimicrobiaceae bacterium]|jgi:type I restriction-modification system DNA methylase subunit|nr:SAM-dependent methyltransferase [Lentimicrobiaceae bacterium]